MLINKSRSHEKTVWRPLLAILLSVTFVSAVAAEGEQQKEPQKIGPATEITTETSQDPGTSEEAQKESEITQGDTGESTDKQDTERSSESGTHRVIREDRHPSESSANEPYRNGSRQREQPYSSYEEWLQNNPRYTHPIHERVHRNSWSEQVRRNQDRAYQARRSGQDPASVEYEEPRVITPEDITYDPNDWDKFYPYPRSRVLWFNDRYPSSRYYPHDDQGTTNRYYSRVEEDRRGAEQRPESGEQEPHQQSQQESGQR